MRDDEVVVTQHYDGVISITIDHAPPVAYFSRTLLEQLDSSLASLDRRQDGSDILTMRGTNRTVQYALTATSADMVEGQRVSGGPCHAG